MWALLIEEKLQQFSSGQIWQGKILWRWEWRPCCDSPKGGPQARPQHSPGDHLQQEHVRKMGSKDVGWRNRSSKGTRSKIHSVKEQCQGRNIPPILSLQRQYQGQYQIGDDISLLVVILLETTATKQRVPLGKTESANIWRKCFCWLWSLN